MHRTCLVLLLFVACVDANAREVRLSSSESPGGADVAVVERPQSRKPASAAREAGSAHESRVRPSVHGDLGNSPRTRWHSFLPGMFR